MLIENQNSEGSLEITRWIQLVRKGFTSTSSTVFWWFLQWPFRKATYLQHHTICLLFCTYKYKCLSRLQMKDRLPKKKKKAIWNLTVHPQFTPSLWDEEGGECRAIMVNNQGRHIQLQNPSLYLRNQYFCSKKHTLLIFYLISWVYYSSQHVASREKGDCAVLFYCRHFLLIKLLGFFQVGF